jgi:hypothetical protein
MKRRNTVTHAAKVVAALHALQSGKADSKRVAAEQAGISTTALTPQVLANTSRNPLLRSLIRCDPLDITADVDGKRVSMREALSKGAESSVRTLARLSQRNGELTKAEQEQVRQCKTWLDLCRNMGMFREMDAPTLPGELAGVAQADEDDDSPEIGSVEWYLMDTSRHAQPDGLRVIPDASAIPLQDQGITQSGKEGDKPFHAQAAQPQ